MNSYHITLITTIREAFQLLKEIPAEQWQGIGFYDKASGRSDMLGWYVRLTNAQQPTAISSVQYRLKAAKLACAINNLLEYCITPDSNTIDAYGICAGYHQAFQHPDPRERSLACLELILSVCDTEVPPLNKVGDQTPPAKPQHGTSKRTASHYYPIA